MNSDRFFDKCGGYRKLHSFTYATIIHIATIDFCNRFVSYKVDPLGKTVGQMVGAARSGRQNIIEGSERSATSKETEMKLTDVARASLAELLGDYEIYLAERNNIPWSKSNINKQTIENIRLEPFENSKDQMHDYWVYFHETRKLFANWLDSSDDTIVANTLIILIQRTMAMLNRQIQKQGEMFLAQGGFREKMYTSRVEVRTQNKINLKNPSCPECGKPMVERIPKTGKNKGVPFWGCSTFPECKGTKKKDDA